MLGLRRIDHYVLSELATPTLLGLLLYTFVLLMNAFFFVARQSIQKGLSVGTTLDMLLLELPNLLVLTIPMATLLGVMIAIGRLSGDHEIVAMQGAGIGLRSLLRPVVVHGLLATVTAFVVYSVIAPEANYAKRTLRAEILTTTNPASDLRPRVFYSDLPGAVLFVDEIRAGSRGELDRVLLYQWQTDGGAQEQLVLARTGSIRPAADGSGAIEVDLEDGILHAFRSSNPETYRYGTFGRKRERFEPLEFVRFLRATPPTATAQDMNLPELRDELRDAKDEPDPILRTHRVRRTWIEIHQRLALPFACLLFSILALPLGVTRVRSGKGAGFALSLLVILVYWLTFTTLRDQADRGRVPVLIGVWAADLVVVAWAIWAFRRVRKGRRGERRPLVRRVVRSALRLLRPGASSQGLPSAADEEVGPPPAPSSRFIGLLDGYIVRLYLRIFVFAVVSAYLVYTIVEMKGLVDDVLQRRESLVVLVDYLKYFAPGRADIVVPIACLIAAVVSLTLLARTGELTALKAGGRSVHRATVPILLTTLAICLLLGLVQNEIAPVTNRKAQEVRDRIQGRAPRSYGLVPGGRWTFGSEGRLYHYRLYDPEAGRFQGLSVFRVALGAPRVLDHRFALSARWTGRAWELEDGWHRTFPPDGTVGFETYERSVVRGLDPPETFARREASWTAGSDLPEQMSLGELTAQIAALADSGYDTTRFRVAWFAKLAQPLTPLVMVVLGLPFSFRVGRRGSLYGIGVAFLLVLLYWATFAVFHALGLETLLPPFLAAWAPNILFAAVGAYLQLYVRT